MAQALTIGRLARASGVRARTIRYYEQVGVLPPASRTAAGYRQYGERTVHRLQFVRRARALGLSLGDLRVLTAALDGAARAEIRPRLLAVVRAQLGAVERQLADLQLLERQLGQVLQRLVAGPRGSDHADGCRCLEMVDGCRCLDADRVPARRPPHRPRAPRRSERPGRESR
jgi:DNA-binding transcriptional MerR regulator